ncbi:hypothetical protein [Nonomuraea typhae]|uniref:hypothetical protein n=1 Tax=Nonomuraea typhae TaxID=2603600 RepID=UPI0012FB5C0C|nr:hypothetical protein [Nonomuraea typhae]
MMSHNRVWIRRFAACVLGAGVVVAAGLVVISPAGAEAIARPDASVVRLPQVVEAGQVGQVKLPR